LTSLLQKEKGYPCKQAGQWPNSRTSHAPFGEDKREIWYFLPSTAIRMIDLGRGREHELSCLDFEFNLMMEEMEWHPLRSSLALAVSKG